MAYDYGRNHGLAASEALQLPIAELLGFYASMKVQLDDD